MKSFIVALGKVFSFQQQKKKKLLHSFAKELFNVGLFLNSNQPYIVTVLVLPFNEKFKCVFHSNLFGAEQEKQNFK
jgi:hypothetical protein